MVLAFGTMGWFGIGRAFGMRVEGLLRSGPYRFSRNPQMVGGWLMVLGVVVYRPSAYAAGWVVIWVLLGHWMITAKKTISGAYSARNTTPIAKRPRGTCCTELVAESYSMARAATTPGWVIVGAEGSCRVTLTSTGTTVRSIKVITTISARRRTFRP